MDYTQAAETLLNKDAVSTVLFFLIAIAVLLVLAAQVVKACKELFGKEPESSTLETHCKASEERFERGERHIAENHEHIMDLREGQRVNCIANIALLNHAIHNGNTAEMEGALHELNQYLINRK